MNILADESVDRQVVDRLRAEGHDVVYIAEIEPSVSDDVVFDRANEKSALLLTTDKDFGEIVYQKGRLISDGIVLIRLSGLAPETKASIVVEAVKLRGAEFAKHFTVLSPGKLRIRSKTTISRQ